jgi:hypothetical protein
MTAPIVAVMIEAIQPPPMLMPSTPANQPPRKLPTMPTTMSINNPKPPPFISWQASAGVYQAIKHDKIMRSAGSHCLTLVAAITYSCTELRAYTLGFRQATLDLAGIQPADRLHMSQSNQRNSLLAKDPHYTMNFWEEAPTAEWWRH